MKICIAQIKPLAGDIEKNIEKHKTFIELAVNKGSDLVFFPELSVTGYEPKLAGRLATDKHDKRFDSFQKISNTKNIIIAIGMPTTSSKGVLISMIIFQPNKDVLLYSKQMLHSDEEPYFVSGQQQLILSFASDKIAPAICYESLQHQHSADAGESGATVYLASVAKSASGVEKAYRHYPDIGKKYGMAVLMANCIGPCDDFEGAGRSSVLEQKWRIYRPVEPHGGRNPGF